MKRSLFHTIRWHGAGLLLVLGVFGIANGPAQEAIAVPSNIEDIHLSVRKPSPALPAQGMATPAPEDIAKATLAPGYLLSLQVTGIPELSGLSLRVDQKGNVTIPGIAPQHLAGMTVEGAEDALTKALVADQWLTNPLVHLDILQFAADYVSVMGEVNTPGRFPLVVPHSLSDVIALANGETMTAGNEIQIRHKDGSGQLNPTRVKYQPGEPISKLQDVMVAPGDTVYIPRAGAIYVLGAVHKAGGYLMVNGGTLSIYEALSLAGGTELDAARNKMVIIRRRSDKYEQIKVPFSDISKKEEAESQLQINDILYVPKSGWKTAVLDGSAIVGATIAGTLYAVH